MMEDGTHDLEILYTYLGGAGGAGVMLFVIGFLSYCIIINVQDRQPRGLAPSYKHLLM